MYVRVVSQVIFSVVGQNVFRELQERVLKWSFAPKRYVRGIPDGAWDGETFEIDTDSSEYAAAIKLEDPTYWAFRCKQSLWDLANRIWTTDVGIGKRPNNEVVFGCRLTCSQRGSQLPHRSVPQFVRGIAFTQVATLDKRRISPDPWIVRDEQSVNELLQLLQNRDRRNPVVVFALPEGSNDDTETAIPVGVFLRKTVGCVHCVIITSDASFLLTDRLGREFSVYKQAIRTYNPGFDPNVDLSSEHPVASVGRIQNWSDDEENEGSFTEFLVDQSLRPRCPRSELEELHPPFDRVRRVYAERRRRKASDAHQEYEQLLELADDDRRAAEREANSTMELLSLAEEERDQATRRVEYLKSENYRLRERNHHMECRLRDLCHGMESPIPDNLDEFRTWVDRELAGEVVLHSRAYRGIDKSEYEDPRLIYSVLLLLRDHYVPMRRHGGPQRRSSYDARCADLGIKETLTISNTREGEQDSNLYRVAWGSDGSKRKLDRHLKKGSEHNNDRTCFRLYFFWDDEGQQVVVGWLPSHLRTRIT